MTSKIKKPEFSVIAGCFRGLAHLLTHFTQSAEDGFLSSIILSFINSLKCRLFSFKRVFADQERSFEIFKYLRMAIDPTVTVHRYEMTLSALEVIKRHATQFCRFLLKEYKVLVKKITATTIIASCEVYLSFQMLGDVRTLEVLEYAQQQRRNACWIHGHGIVPERSDKTQLWQKF